MTKVNQLIFILTLSLSTSVCAIPRSDVLECGLPDGSKFILTSKYQWNPININPHGSSKNHQEPFLTNFQPKNSFNKIEISGSVGYSHLDVDTANSLCASHGLHRNIAYDGVSGYYSFHEKQFFELTQDDKFYIPAIIKNRAARLQEKLDSMRLSVYPGHGAVSIINQKIIKERSLEGIEVNTIQAVWQSTSTDNGKTWTDPIITKEAKIFELGKTIYEQSFIARPISINGKKIEAHFPSQNAK
jgi:hypothetical protein